VSVAASPVRSPNLSSHAADRVEKLRLIYLAVRGRSGYVALGLGTAQYVGSQVWLPRRPAALGVSSSIFSRRAFSARSRASSAPTAAGISVTRTPYVTRGHASHAEGHSGGSLLVGLPDRPLGVVCDMTTS
jgi:hypothetical protein